MEVDTDDVFVENLYQLIAELKEGIQRLNTRLTCAENQLKVLSERKKIPPPVQKAARRNRTFAELEAKVLKLNAESGDNYVITKEDLSSPMKEEFVLSTFNPHITERFSRQMLLSDIGVEGQKKILNASVLVIGCGGIGSACIQYLAACGVGMLGLVDYDSVELSNLHRQVIHTSAKIGKTKVASAKAYVEALNSNVIVNMHEVLLDSSNAYDIIRLYDVVCDACDNAPTRYLVNDACLKAERPLISASALGMEGQLCVYCYKDAPCYRCVHPVPAPPETVGSCGENGVLGPVPGIMGTLQAVETIKLIVGEATFTVLEKLLIYVATTSRFLSVRLRSKNPECICARPEDITLVDYEQFCGSKANDKTPDISILETNDHISVRYYRHIFLEFGVKHTLVDVRSQEEFDMVHVRHALRLNVGYFEKLTGTMEKDKTANLREKDIPPELSTILQCRYIFCICRRGNDSQKAVIMMKKYIAHLQDVHKLSPEDCIEGTTVPIGSYVIKNIKGGYYGWHKLVDNTISIY